MNEHGIELRDAGEGRLVLEGHPSISEVWYPVGRAFREKFRRGAWKRGLNEGPHTVLLTDHEGLALSSTKTPSGVPTLRLSETDRGLFCEADLDGGAPRVQDLRSTAENAGLQMSVGFLCQDDSWSDDGKRREVRAASLHKGDVTVCNFGANGATDAAISERASLGAAERRALKGSRERRMCPELDGYELRTEASLTVARDRLGILRSELDLARAKRARLDHRDTPKMPAHPHVSPRYTYAEIQALGKEGLAHKRKDGKYNFPIVDRRDLLDAVLAIGRAGSEAFSVKRWIVYRAKLLGMKSDIPKAWVVEVGEAVPA